MDNAQEAFAPGTQVKVESITVATDEIYIRVEEALEELVDSMEQVAIFEFTATKGGEPVQPEEGKSVSVTFAIPDSLTANNLKLYYVAVNGVKTEIQDIEIDAAKRTVTATLPHFSTYVLVNERTTAVVDKAALNDAIAQAEALVEKDYTAESWTVLQSALAAAKDVAAMADATQVQVGVALADLEAAVKALVDANAGVQPTQQPDQDAKPTASQAPVTDNVPPTGDQTDMTLWISLLVVCAVVVVAIVAYRAKSGKKS